VKIALLISLALIGLLVAVEIGLRLIFGFGNPLLYIADNQIGYLLAPTQDVYRFGNHIQVNRYSMRSADITPERSPHTLRLLLLGDSVANGGWWTDQDDIISNLMEAQLKSTLTQGSFKAVEVLNASANSWSPRNELAYLRRFGTFEAQIVILLLNTDDLFGTAPTSLPVGRDRNYPDHKPPLALVEVVSRYLLKQAPIPELEKVQAEGGDRVGVNLDAIDQVNQLITQARGQLLLGMTPLLREVSASGPKDYELKARKRLTDFTLNKSIPYVDFLPVFNAISDPKTLYRDHIHISPEGNYLVSQTLIDAVHHILINPHSAL